MAERSEARIAATLREVADWLVSGGVTRVVRETIDRELLHDPGGTSAGWMARRYTELVYGCRPEQNTSPQDRAEMATITKAALPKADKWLRDVLQATLQALGCIAGKPSYVPTPKDIQWLRTCADLLCASTESEGADSKQTIPVVEVSRWCDLSIGIGTGSFLALPEQVVTAARFPKTKAVSLPLAGRRWPVLLKLLAESHTGAEASVKDLITALGYMGDAGTTKAERIAALGNARKRLGNAIRDFRREIRGVVSGPKGKLLELDETAGKITSAFVVRHLLPDADGVIRFGRQP